MNEAKRGREAVLPVVLLATAIALGSAGCSGARQPNTAPQPEQTTGSTEPPTIEGKADAALHGINARVMDMVDKGSYYVDSNGKTVTQTITYGAGPGGKYLTIEREVQDSNAGTLGVYRASLGYKDSPREANDVSVSKDLLPDDTPSKHEKGLSFYHLGEGNYRVVYDPDSTGPEDVKFLDTAGPFEGASEIMNPKNLGDANDFASNNFLTPMENAAAFNAMDN